MKYILLASLIFVCGCAGVKNNTCRRTPLTKEERIQRLEEKAERLEKMEERIRFVDSWNFEVYMDQENRIRRLEGRKKVGEEELEYGQNKKNKNSKGIITE